MLLFPFFYVCTLPLPRLYSMRVISPFARARQLTVSCPKSVGRDLLSPFLTHPHGFDTKTRLQPFALTGGGEREERIYNSRELSSFHAIFFY